MPRIFHRQMYPQLHSSHTHLLLPSFFLFLTLRCVRYGVDVRVPGLILLREECPDSWVLFAPTHALHSHLHWSWTTLQFLLCTVRAFTGHGQHVLLIRPRKRAPKIFTVSKTISFLREWQVCSYSIPPNKWEPYDHKARESTASLHCSFSTKHLSNLCMGKDSSVNVRPVHYLGYCQNRCGPFVGPNTVVKPLLFCPFFPWFLYFAYLFAFTDFPSGVLSSLWILLFPPVLVPNQDEGICTKPSLFTSRSANHRCRGSLGDACL